MDDNLILLPGVPAPAEAPPPEESAAAAAEATDEATDEAVAPADLDKPPPHLVPAVVEALLLVTDKPLSVRQIDDVLEGPGEALVTQALHDLQERLRRQAGGIRLIEVAKGWQLRTDVRTGPWVAAFRGAKPMRLSKAALETLAVVAYRQPVTRSEIEGLRGVDSGGVLRMLAEKGIVSASGRSDEPGRPLYYTTTSQFLELFALRDLSDLPTLRDLRELKQDDPREQLPEGDEAGPAGAALAELSEAPSDVAAAPEASVEEPALAPDEEILAESVDAIEEAAEEILEPAPLPEPLDA
jgi:segregation and condensation protein B